MLSNKKKGKKLDTTILRVCQTKSQFNKRHIYKLQTLIDWYL